MTYGTIKVDTIENTNGLTGNAIGPGFKNKIINGDMRIDQRNAGAAVTTNGAFPVDRFFVTNATDGAFSAQQNSSAPTGFVNSLKFTATTADTSLGSTQYISVQQRIEGTNISDLAWGSANAKTVTLSFWVRSSLTGTFGGCLVNDSTDRSYPFTYSISVADTWEQKSVTVSGDTTGTWLTTTGIGIRLIWGLGVGSSLSGTAGAWAAANYVSATGAVSVIGTLNATWYITGVQLEVGGTATSFDYRPYGTELALCERYCRKMGDGLWGKASSSTTMVIQTPFNLQPMRATPTVTSTDSTVKTSDVTAADFTSSAGVTGGNMTQYGGRVTISSFTGLTSGGMYIVYDNTDGSIVLFSAEL